MEDIYSYRKQQEPFMAIQTKVPAANGSTFGPGQTVRFDLPASMGFVDPKRTYLVFNLALASDRYVRPQPDYLGANVLIRSMTIRAGDGQVMEELSDYNAYVGSLLAFHADNATLQQMIEVEAAVTEQVGTALQTADPRWLGQAAFKVCLPLRGSGLFNGDSLIPVKALGGLSVECELDETAVLQQQAAFTVDQKACQDIAIAANQAWVDLTNITTLAGNAGLYHIGQTVVIDATVDGTAHTRSTLQTITGLSIVNPVPPAPADPHLRLTLSPGTNMFATHAGTVVVLDVTGDGAAVADYVLTAPNISCSVPQDVPASFAGRKLTWDIISCTNMRGQVPANALQSVNNIPSQAQRALAILSVPMESANVRSLDHSFAGGRMEASSYRYQLFGKPAPSRAVSCRHAGRVDAQQAVELYKALSASRADPRNMGETRNFCIGRALSSMGGSSDMRQSGASLEITYSAATAAAIQHNFVVHARRINIQDGQIRVDH